MTVIEGQASDRHSVVQRLLAEGERCASLASPYSWLPPLYSGAPGQTILQAFDRIAWRWTYCGFRVAASGGHTIELSVSGGDGTIRSVIRSAPVPEHVARRGRPRSRPLMALWLDADRNARKLPVTGGGKWPGATVGRIA